MDEVLLWRFAKKSEHVWLLIGIAEAENAGWHLGRLLQVLITPNIQSLISYVRSTKYPELRFK